MNHKVDVFRFKPFLSEVSSGPGSPGNAKQYLNIKVAEVKRMAAFKLDSALPDWTVL